MITRQRYTADEIKAACESMPTEQIAAIRNWLIDCDCPNVYLRSTFSIVNVAGRAYDGGMSALLADSADWF